MKKNKQDLYIFIIMIGLIGLTIGYAALSSTLNINGKSNISKNTWDVYFDNVVVKDDSIEAVKIPTVTDKTTVDFEVALNLPGDFYEFTVDVINDGTIDAMIESITKDPELTEAQQKYLNYTITYENGEQISKKQLVKVEEFVRLKVRVELRKDIEASDLPDVGDVLYLGFTVNYQQADNTGIDVKDNGKYINPITVVSGDGTQTGDEICIGEECFYVMYSDETSVTLLAKYNLYIGGEFDNSTSEFTRYNHVTGNQNQYMLGWISNGNLYKGIIRFSVSNYWGDKLSSSDYPAYVFNENSLLYKYVENYKTYLSTLGVTISEARLITYEELIALGCSDSSCSSAPSWIYATSYWSGFVFNFVYVYSVDSYGRFGGVHYTNESKYGCRPVIVLSKEIIVG